MTSLDGLRNHARRNPPPDGYRDVLAAGKRRQRRALAGVLGSAAIIGVAIPVALASTGDRQSLVVEEGNLPVTGSTPTPISTSPDCPRFGSPPGGGFAIVEYVDFLQALGRNYIAGLGHMDTITNNDLGSQVLVVRCSIAAVNNTTHQVPLEPFRDGDAAYLAPGTPVYSVHGWPISCRLAARRVDGALHVYLAYQPNTRVATPEACALRAANTG